MGATIEYARTAVRIPGMKEDLFLLNAEMGESNCIDETGRRARRWSSYWFGTATECMQRVALLAGSCEGGSLQVGPNKRTIKPETYIANWRKTLHDAPYRGGAGLTANIPEVKEYSYRADTPEEMKLLAADHARQGLATYNGRHWQYQLNDPASASALRDVMKLAPHGWFHQSCLPQSVGWLAEAMRDDVVPSAAPKDAAKPLDLVKIFHAGRDRFETETYLVVDKAGKVLSLGSKWSVVSILLKLYAHEVEAATGATESQIRVWRQMMEKAATVSGSLLLPVANLNEWTVQEITSLGAVLQDGHYRVSLEKARNSWVAFSPEQDARVELSTTAELFAEVA